MTIDIKITDPSTIGNAEFYVGSNGTYYVSPAWSIASDINWTTHVVTLDTLNFTPWTQGGAGTASLADVLKSPDDISARLVRWFPSRRRCRCWPWADWGCSGGVTRTHGEACNLAPAGMNGRLRPDFATYCGVLWTGDLRAARLL